MGFSRNFLWLMFGMIPFFLSSGCGDLEPEMQDTRTVVLKMDFNKRSSSRSSQVSAADIAAYQTHLILALPSLESIFPWTASSSYQNHYHNSLAKALMIPPAEPMPKSGQVTMEIPLNTKNMRIAAFLFKQDYDIPQLEEVVREVGYFGESEPFPIGTNTNSHSLGITLHSAFPIEPDYDDLDDGGGDFGGGDFDVGTHDFTAPTVSFSPANETVGVDVNGNITITFNEAVRKIDNTMLTDSNIDNLITLKLNNASGSNINFDATINTDKTVITINPTSNLPNSQAVYVAIGATLEDYAENLITAVNASFTTESSTDSTLLAHYAFEGNLNDNSSYNRHLTEAQGSQITYSDINFQNNISGQAALFNGINTYAYTDNISIAHTDNWTISFWTKPESSNMSQWDSVMSTGDTNTTSGGIFQIDYTGNNQLRFNTSGIMRYLTLDDGEWQHFVFTKNYTSTSDMLYYYKNGEPQSYASMEPFGTRWDKIKIGLNRLDDSYWKGYIDDIRIYNRTLTADEVEELFESYE